MSDDEHYDVLALLVRLWLRNQTEAERIFAQLDEGQDWSLMAADLRAELDKLR
jgi:hypothetical protein